MLKLFQLLNRSAVIAILLCGAAAQNAHPDFSGSWKLTPSFNQPKAANRSSYKIKLRGDKLEVTHFFDGKPEVSAYVLDGKKRTARIYPTEVQAKAYWEDDTIVIEKEEKIIEYNVKSVSKYILSPNGTLLTIRNHSFASGIFPEVTEERVYEKH